MILTRHTTLSSPQPLLFSRLTDIAPQIRFACFVGSRKLVAAVTHREDTGIEILYRVSFSDGHEDAYKPVVKRNGHLILHDVYAEAIADDLCVVHTLREEGREVLLNFRVDHQCGHSMNVWIEKRDDTYRVYFSGEYQFHLRKREAWEQRTSRTERDYHIDSQLTTLIEQELDKRNL